MSEVNTDVLKYFEAVELESLDKFVRKKVDFATEIFAELARLIKSITLYGAQHQSSLNFRNRFFEVLTRGLIGGNSISVEVQTYALVIAEQVVYENPKIDQNFVYRFYTDGIRSLTLNYGVTADEVDKLLNVFLLDWSDPGLFEDDVVTLMWEKHFEHIHYTLAPPSQNDNEEVSTHLTSLSKQLDRLSDLLHTCENGIEFDTFDHVLNSHKQKEIEHLTHINQRELLEKLIALTYASQQGEHNLTNKTQDRFVQLLDQLALLFSKRNDVSELERFLRQAFRISPENQEKLINLWATPKFIQSILIPLKTQENAQSLSAFACLQILGHKCIPYIAGKIGDLTETHFQTLSKLMLPYFSKYPIEIGRALRSGEYLQGKRLIEWGYQSQDLQLALKVFQVATSHQDQGVRYEALVHMPKTIAQEALVLKTLYAGVDDPYSKIRTLCIYTLSHSTHSDVQVKIREILHSKKVQNLSIIDLRKIYATAALQGVESKLFYDMIQKSTSLLGKQKQQKYAAIVALSMSVDAKSYKQYLIELQQKRFSHHAQLEAIQWGIHYLEATTEQKKQMVYELFFRGILALPKGVKI
jgi:hypothetical protein